MYSANRFKQRVVLVVGMAALLIIMSMLVTSTAFATPSRWGVSWDYRLLGPLNSALDPDTGRTIVITGSGSFDLSQATIDGGGSYTILENGNVVGSGRWWATTFDPEEDFTPHATGNSPGQGGRLELEASFDGALNGSFPMVIQCSMWGSESDNVGPPGYPWPQDFVTVGPYSEPVFGAVMFNLNQ